MTQLTFQPPVRDPEVDILQHLWATKHAINSWYSFPPKFVEIRINREVEFLFKVHPRLLKEQFTSSPFNSVWGIPLRVDETLSDNPGYEVVYVPQQH